MLFLDSSAWLKRYVDEEGTQVVIDAMTTDPAWVGSALANVETGIALCRLPFDAAGRSHQQRRQRQDWEHFRVVPIDAACLGLALELGCRHGVRTLDAIHLAAASRLPRPFRFLTFDTRQGAAARAMGFEVLDGNLA